MKSDGIPNARDKGELVLMNASGRCFLTVGRSNPNTDLENDSQESLQREQRSICKQRFKHGEQRDCGGGPAWEAVNREIVREGDSKNALKRIS
ncbi:hypothetical protein U1Q18_016379 [Sarracenia purpurea var. burkii]